MRHEELALFSVFCMGISVALVDALVFSSSSRDGYTVRTELITENRGCRFYFFELIKTVMFVTRRGTFFLN